MDRKSKLGKAVLNKNVWMSELCSLRWSISIYIDDFVACKLVQFHWLFAQLFLFPVTKKSTTLPSWPCGWPPPSTMRVLHIWQKRNLQWGQSSRFGRNTSDSSVPVVGFRAFYLWLCWAPPGCGGPLLQRAFSSVTSAPCQCWTLRRRCCPKCSVCGSLACSSLLWFVLTIYLNSCGSNQDLWSECCGRIFFPHIHL